MRKHKTRMRASTPLFGNVHQNSDIVVLITEFAVYDAAANFNDDRHASLDIF